MKDRLLIFIVIFLFFIALYQFVSTKNYVESADKRMAKYRTEIEQLTKELDSLKQLNHID
jgi:uncharacterized protein YpmB